VVLSFNNIIDPVSARINDNYKIFARRKPVKIDHIQVSGKRLFLRIKDEELHGKRDSIEVSVHDIKDTDGNVLDKRKLADLYQYRELFVQEYNKPLPLKDSCFMQYLPLESNCISTLSGKEKYWMNTPENIKIIK
jgi:hypothetical protein